MIIGSLMIYMAFRSEYESSFLDVFFILGLIFLGVILFSLTINKEISAFKKEKVLRNFTFTLIFLACIAVAIFKADQVKDNFNKPTLLKVYYDGDYNGTAIDFKTDGTFIFDNNCIGFNWYMYGNYTITDNKIFLDKNNLDNVIVTNKLEIHEKEIFHGNETISRPSLSDPG